MTQFSMLPWETQTGTGDGANSYTQDQANNFFRYFDVRDPANEGVAYGVLNALAVSGTASPLSVASGAAVCYGRYWNDAAVALAVTTPVVGTTGGRVVLRADWSANTIRLFVKMSTDGNGTIPALVQTAGTTWEISLATFTVTTGGVITVTDNRTFIKSTSKIAAGDINDVAMIANALITGAKIANETIVPGNVVNRTRRFFVPVVDAENSTDVTTISRNGYAYVVFPNNKLCGVNALTAVPSDYSSGITVYAICVPQFAGAANVYVAITADYVGIGGDAGTAGTITALAVDGGLGAKINALQQTRQDGTPSATALLQLYFARDAVDASDTLAANLNFYGWLVEYTADS